MIRVDGREVDARGATVLDVCRRAGADVPTLCHDGRTDRGGRCRACIVEVDGRAVPACTTPPRDGTVVQTHTPRLLEYRRDLAELMAVEAEAHGRVSELATQWAPW